MKRKTYKIIDDESILVAEEILDEAGNVLYAIDYSAKPIFEKKSIYNQEGLPIERIELEGGIELSKALYRYNNKQELVESHLFIDGELYEKEVIEYSAIGFKKIIYRDREEVSRIIHEEKGRGITIKFFEYGSPIGKNIIEISNDEKLLERKILGAENQLYGTEKELSNNDGLLIKREKFDAKGNLIYEANLQVDGRIVIGETHRDLIEQENSYQVNWEFDERGNCIRSETKDLTGNLLDFFIKNFDLQNRIIEEVSLSHGSGDAISGGFQSSIKNHFKYEYEP